MLIVPTVHYKMAKDQVQKAKKAAKKVKSTEAQTKRKVRTNCHFFKYRLLIYMFFISIPLSSHLYTLSMIRDFR